MRKLSPPCPLWAMRLLCLLMICCYSFGLTAQDTKVSVNFNRIPLKQALAELQAKSGCNFLYNSQLIDDSRLVSTNQSDAELSNVLDALFAGTTIRYSVDNKQIVLYVANPANAAQQENGAAASGHRTAAGPANGNVPADPAKTISGTVYDPEGQPLPGAVVTVKGNAKKYALANADGQFELSDVEAGTVLVFSCIGHETQEVPVGASNVITVNLQQAVNVLDDVVVTGYQTISRERTTGSFNRVRSDVLEQRRASDLSSALLGTVAGMQGKENEDGSINYTIRGTTSLYADAAPLVVVDGFPVSSGFKDINPNDVESVTVLKDAAAASIWGARSANGVIVVTTKRAGADGSPQGVTVNVNAMVKIGSKLDLNTILTTASSKDHVDYEKMAFDNKWFSWDYGGAFSAMKLSPLTLAAEQLYAHRSGKITEAQLNDRLNELRNTNNRGQIKDLLLENPILQQYNVTVNSSNNRVKNYLSALYEHGKGNMVENHNNRWRLHYNNQVSVFKWLDFSLATNLHLFRNTTNGPTIGELRTLSPYEMILDPKDGSYAEQLKLNRELRATIPEGQLPYEDWTYNILREARARDLTAEQLNTRVQAGLTFKFMEGLKLTSSIQYEYNKGAVRNLYTEDAFYTRDFVNTWIDYTHSDTDPSLRKLNKQFVPNGAILKTQQSTNENYVWRNQLDFDKTFGDGHAVVATAGMEIQEYKTNEQRDPWVFGYNSARNSSALIGFDPSAPIKDISGSNPYYIFPGISNTTREGLLPVYKYLLDRYVSVYGNIAYTYAGKYSVTGSVRSDASNLIADNASYRWTPLWSIGGKWNISQENFMQSTGAWLDRLSLRLTYGFNGNVEKSTSHKTLIETTTAPSATFGGAYTGSVEFGNPELRWEKTSSLNFGVDFALFNNLVFGSVDVYNKKGKDVIGKVALPSVLGTATQKRNNAEVSNKGIEVEMGVHTKITENIRFTGKLTYAYNKNKITTLYNPNSYAYAMLEKDAETGRTAYVEGYPVEGIWGYHYRGMEDGIPYVDGIGGLPSSMNDVQLHNRQIGLQFLQYAGPGIAPHTLGLNAGVSGYGFTLSFFINGTFGGHFRNPTFDYTMTGRDKVIIPEFVGEVLNGSDKVPEFPLPNATQTYLWNRYVPNLLTMVENSSFIKLKEINLEYNLPGRWTNYIGVGSTRVFAQIRDLGCLWTNNSRGYDPEWLPGTMKPATTYAFGINVNF